jgi:hypothetical protein
MDEAAPAAAGEAAEKKRSFLRRVPASVYVTLLGIALTAWLLPAFTRQWDDRQKAQELKTSLITEMTAATTDVVVKSRYAFSPSFPGREPLGLVVDRWLLNSVQLENKLRAYFLGSGIADTWHNFSTLVDNTLEGVLGEESITPVLIGTPYELLERMQGKRGLKAYKARMNFVTDESALPARRRQEYAALQRTLLTMEEKIAARVLVADPSGYSTTRGDFFHDLVP